MILVEILRCLMISFIFKSKMQIRITIAGINILSLFPLLIIFLLFNCIACNGDRPSGKTGKLSTIVSDSNKLNVTPDESPSVSAMLILPKNPAPGEPFRILATGGENIRKAHMIITGTSGSLESLKSKTGTELPSWRIDDFSGISAGKYKAV